MTVRDAINTLRADPKLTSNMIGLERDAALAWAERRLLLTQCSGECDMGTYREVEWTFTLANIGLILASDQNNRDIITGIISGDEC